MSLVFGALQKAILDRLRSDVAVTSLLNQEKNTKGIYDYVTESTVYPYIVIGEPRVDAFSVKSEDVKDYTITLHIWSNYKGNSEAYKILSAIYESLKYKLKISGYNTVKTSCSDTRVFTDIDGIHRHGIFVLKISLQKEK